MMQPGAIFGQPVVADEDPLPPLWAAAARGDAVNLKRLLAAYPQTVNEPWRRTGVTPLQVAVKEGHVACVKLLLKARADFTAESPIDRKNSLSIAAAAGNAEICEAILTAAGPYARDFLNKRNSDGSAALLLAASFGHGRTVAKLLEFGANGLIVDEEGLAAIEVGIREGKREVVQALAAGAPLPAGREAGVIRAVVALCKADTPCEAIVKQPSAGRLNIALMMLIQAKWLARMRRVGADEGRHLIARATTVTREVLDGYEAYYQLNVDRRKSGFRSVAQIVLEDALNGHQSGDEAAIRRAFNSLVPKVEGLPREFGRLQTDLWNVFAEGRALGRQELGLRAREGVERFLNRPREDSHEVLNFTFERGLEPTAKALAVRSGAPEVISHPFVTRYVHDVWWGNGYEVDFREEKALKGKVGRTPFSRTACVKFALDSAFYVALLALLTTIVVRPYGHGVAVEAAFWSMAMVWWISEILKFAFIGTTQYTASLWNWLDAIINILLFVAAAWRLANWVAGLNGPNEGYSKELLAALTVPMYFRLLPMFGIFRPVGHAIVVIEAMVVNICTVSFVVVAGFFGFSVCMTFFLQRGEGSDGPVWIFFNTMWSLFENLVGDMHFDSRHEGISVTALRMVHRVINGLFMLYLLIALFTNSVGSVLRAGRTAQAAQKVYVATALMYSSRSIVTIPPFGILYAPFAILCSPTRAESEMRRFYEAIIYFLPDMAWFCFKFVFGCFFQCCANFCEACGFCRCRPAWQDFRRYVVRRSGQHPNDAHGIKPRVPSVMVPPGALAGQRAAAAKAAAKAAPVPKLGAIPRLALPAPQAALPPPAPAPPPPPARPSLNYAAPPPKQAAANFGVQPGAVYTVPAPPQPSFQAPPPVVAQLPPFAGTVQASVYDVLPSAHEGQPQQHRAYEPPNAYERPRLNSGIPPVASPPAYFGREAGAPGPRAADGRRSGGRRSHASERGEEDGIIDSIGRWFKDDLFPVFTGRSPDRRGRRPERGGRLSYGATSTAGSAGAYEPPADARYGAPPRMQRPIPSPPAADPWAGSGPVAPRYEGRPTSARSLSAPPVAANIPPPPPPPPPPTFGRARSATNLQALGQQAAQQQQQQQQWAVPEGGEYDIPYALIGADPLAEAAAVAAACIRPGVPVPGWELPGDAPLAAPDLSGLAALRWAAPGGLAEIETGRAPAMRSAGSYGNLSMYESQGYDVQQPAPAAPQYGDLQPAYSAPAAATGYGASAVTYSAPAAAYGAPALATAEQALAQSLVAGALQQQAAQQQANALAQAQADYEVAQAQYEYAQNAAVQQQAAAQAAAAQAAQAAGPYPGYAASIALSTQPTAAVVPTRPPTTRRGYSGANTPVMAPLTARTQSAATAAAAVQEALALSTGRSQSLQPLPPVPPAFQTQQATLHQQAQALQLQQQQAAAAQQQQAAALQQQQALHAQLQAQLGQLSQSQKLQAVTGQQAAAAGVPAAALADVELEEWDEVEEDRSEDAYRAFFALPELAAGPRAVRPEELPEPYVDLVTDPTERDEKDDVAAYVQDEIMARRPAAAKREHTPAQQARAMRGLSRRLDALAAGQARLADALAALHVAQAQMAAQMGGGGTAGVARGVAVGSGSQQGTIVARVIEARGLKNEDYFGKSDPYAVLKVGGRTKRTRTINNTLSPVWNEEISVEYKDTPAESEVVIELWDEDVGMPDDFLAQLKVPAAALLSGQPVDQWFPLTAADGRTPAGQLHAVLSFRPRAQSAFK